MSDGRHYPIRGHIVPKQTTLRREHSNSEENTGGLVFFTVLRCPHHSITTLHTSVCVGMKNMPDCDGGPSATMMQPCGHANRCQAYKSTTCAQQRDALRMFQELQQKLSLSLPLALCFCGPVTGVTPPLYSFDACLLAPVRRSSQLTT